MNKLEVVKLKKDGMKGVILIKSKYKGSSFSLNYVLLENGIYSALMDEDFEIIGELELDD